jgi:hypothetical protein
MPDTPNRAYTYPASTSNVQLWTHLQNLAVDIDTDVQSIIDLMVETRVATATPITSDSITFTATESVSLGSVTVPQISGQWYEVVLETAVGSTVAADCVSVRIREASAVGTERMIRQGYADTTSTIGFAHTVRYEYQALSTGNVAFHVTGQRNDGTGNCTLKAGATYPRYLYANKIIKA